jgi:hypothetical protein
VLVLQKIWSAPPPAYAALPAARTTVLLNLPLVVPDVALEPYYMYFSSFRWDKLVNGYSGFSPPSYSRLVEVMRTFPDDSAFQELRSRDVEFIIVHGAFYHPRVYAQLIEQLGARRELRLVGTYRWEHRETKVYQMARSGPGG